MIKELRITNFLSFREEIFRFSPGANILIGINGSGKSNLFKALRFFREGVFGIGAERYILELLGGIDSALFMGVGINSFSLELVLDGPKLTSLAGGFRFTEDVIFKVECFKVPGGENFYISENIKTKKGYTYLSFSNGIGLINRHKKLVRYVDFNPQGLALREIRDSDADISIELVTVKKALESFLVYSYFDTTASSPMRKAVVPSLDKRLNFDGSNLAQILNLLKHNHRSSYNQLISLLKEVNPNFNNIEFRQIGKGLELVLEEVGLERTVHVSQISDGTLRFLCLLSIIFNPNPNRGYLICIDEPEVGLHPDMISGLAEAFNQVGDGSTFVISTHSESFIDHFGVESIRVFEKSEDNSTEIKQFTAQELIEWVDEYTSGQLWSKGILGAVRYGK